MCCAIYPLPRAIRSKLSVQNVDGSRHTLRNRDSHIPRTRSGLPHWRSANNMLPVIDVEPGAQRAICPSLPLCVTGLVARTPGRSAGITGSSR